MPQYKAKTNTFVNGRDVRAGQVFYSDAKPSKAWQLIEEASEAEDEKDEKDKAPAKSGKPAPAKG